MIKALFGRLRAAGCALPALGAGAAHAHHPMDGAMPATLAEGLLSGIGHPVIEPGHLFFLLGLAVLAAVCGLPPRRAAGSLALLMLASLGGTLAGASAGVPAIVELALGGTLLLLAVVLWAPREPGILAASLLPVAAGAVHGLAYAEAVIGVENGPVIAYLAGLGMVQGLLLGAVWLVARRLLSSGSAARLQGARWASASMAAAAFFVMSPMS